MAVLQLVNELFQYPSLEIVIDAILYVDPPIPTTRAPRPSDKLCVLTRTQRPPTVLTFNSPTPVSAFYQGASMLSTSDEMSAAVQPST